MDLRQELFTEAHRLGFSDTGVASMEPFTAAREYAIAAIDAGRMKGMPWFTKERIEASADLRPRFPWAQSIIALAWPYAPAGGASDADDQNPVGRISAYACVGDENGKRDYHELLAEKCNALTDWLRQRVPESKAKRFIDHGWAMDRAIAERAGIGFIGKHANLITPNSGSYVLLASLVTSIPMESTPRSTKNCGRCQACIPACPTGAILRPGMIDANRCISFLTIEHRGAIARELRPLMGTWIFGCDICQEACPINSRLAPPPLPDTGRALQSGPVPYADLIECLRLDEAAFQARFRGTAVERTGRSGLVRNCAIALGNLRDQRARSELSRLAGEDSDEVVRESAQWALEQMAS